MNAQVGAAWRLVLKTMPMPVDSIDVERFVQLLRGYLKKTGRKQVELARASIVSESLLSKILNGKTPPNLANFCRFQARFLVAHGAITQARQVVQMAALLGGELDEASLLGIANDVEQFQDPELDSLYFRERAEAFRQTIPQAFSATEAGPVSVSEPEEAAEPLDAGASADAGAVPASDELESQVFASVDEALAAWRAVLRDADQATPPDRLDPDEVIATVLEWASRQSDPQLATYIWDWFGAPTEFANLRQRARLDFMLQNLDRQVTWNQLEWKWLNHVLVETAQRHAGGSQPSPSQLLAFALDLGQVAYEAVKADDGKTPHLTVDLSKIARNLPMAQVTSWNWLSRISQAGLVRLSVSPDDDCQFASREEAEFLAAQYLIHSGTDETLLGIARNCGRPFGVLTQAVRTLHFTGRDEVAAELIGTLLKVSEAVSMRYADAAYLLAACEAAESTVLLPLWDRVEAELCESWAKVPAPDYRDYVARALRFEYCPNFREMLHQAERNEWRSGQHDTTTLRSLAIIGGPDAVETLRSLAEARADLADHVDEQGKPWDPLKAVLAVAHELAPNEEATLLERLALDDPVYDQQWQAVSALAESGTIAALRSLQRVAAGAANPKLRRYAETRHELVESPAYAQGSTLSGRDGGVGRGDGRTGHLRHSGSPAKRFSPEPCPRGAATRHGHKGARGVGSASRRRFTRMAHDCRGGVGQG